MGKVVKFDVLHLQVQMYDSQGRRPPGMGGGGYPDGGQYGQYPSNNQRYPMQQGYLQQVLSLSVSLFLALSLYIYILV